MNEATRTTRTTFRAEQFSPEGKTSSDEQRDPPALVPHDDTTGGSGPPVVRRGLPAGISLVLALLLMLLSATTFGVAYLHADASQHAAIQQAAASLGRPFSIPDDPRFADSDRTYPALSAAAQAAHVNVFRTSAGYTSTDQPETTLYVLLTGPTRLWGQVTLDRGNTLTPGDTRTTKRYLSTANGSNPDQVGVLADFGGNDLVTVRSLGQTFAALPVAGNYAVESPNPEAFTSFLTLFAQQMNRSGVSGNTPLSTDVFTRPGSDFQGTISNNSQLLVAVQYFIVLLITLLLVYRMLQQAKRAAVMKLHGYPTLRVWYAVTGSLVITVLGSATLVATGAALFVHDAGASFVVTIVTSLLTITVVMLATSLVTCLYINRIKVSDSIKNRKDTGGVFVLNTMVKVISAILLITVGAGLWVQYTNVAAEKAKLGNWEMTKDYGVFYPTNVGNDLVEAQTGQVGPTASEVYDLYPILNQQGALFVDTAAYEPINMTNPMEAGTFRSTQVNPNYLQTFPVRDAQGRVIKIDENTRAWVVLAPVSLKPQQAQLLTYFQRGRTGTPTQQGAVQAEKSIFGRSAPEGFAHQKVQIIWTADHQQMFSFNPKVEPTKHNLIADPIIQVMTSANSLGIDRANAMTGSSDTALKVRLINGNTATTLRSLDPALRNLKLDDNLRHLVTMNEYVLLQLQTLRDGVRNVAIAAFALLLAMLILIVQSLTIVFDRYARKVIVRRLFGLRFIPTYREFLRLFVIIGIVQVSGALVANQIGATPFATATSTGATSPQIILSIAAAVITGELLFSAAVLTFIEKRNAIKVLKGEF